MRWSAFRMGIAVRAQERPVSVVVQVQDLTDRPARVRTVPAPERPTERDDRTRGDPGRELEGPTGLRPGPEGQRGEGRAETDRPGGQEQILHRHHDGGIVFFELFGLL